MYVKIAKQSYVTDSSTEFVDNVAICQPLMAKNVLEVGRLL